MSAPPDVPLPKSVLGRHRILAPNASVRVSPLCLGGMSFGTAMKDIMGAVTKDETFEILDYFYDQGGNFIDTANGYQLGQSETWIGEWMKARGLRDEMVIATKYTSAYRLDDKNIQQSNFGGTGSKSMIVSVEASLRKLQTSYIDLLYVHYWDMNSSIPEVMQSLNHLVASGKVLYLGISDTPAWVVVKANCYARQHGLRQFSVYQGRWSAAVRDFEREIIPMVRLIPPGFSVLSGAISEGPFRDKYLLYVSGLIFEQCQDEGMGIAPWGALGGGQFKPKAQIGKDGGRNWATYATGVDESVSEKLELVAKRHGSTMTGIALAYVMAKAPYVYPIVGLRKIDHLKGNIEALKIKLSEIDIQEIESGYDWDPGFPHNMISGLGGKKMPKGPGDIYYTKRLGHFDYVEQPKPITPHQE